MPLRKHIRDFCEKTSMKGVPRIVRTESRVLRAMWLLWVIIFLSLTLYSVTKMLLEYFSFGVNISIIEQRIVFPEMANRIPDVTFCNLNRFNSYSSQILNQENKNIFSNFREKVEDLIKEHERNLDKHTIQELKSHLLSYRTYFEMLGDDVAERIGHSSDIMFQECDIACTDGLHTHHVPCDAVGELIKTQSPDFFNCYTLRPNANALQLLKRWAWKGLSVVLFLDDLPQDQNQHQPSIKGYDVIGGGCDVILHPPHSHPSSVQRKYKASAGTFTTIQVDAWAKSYLPDPHGNCYQTANTPDILGPDGQPVGYVYTRQTCVQACMQRKIKDACGCTDSAIFRCRESFPFCGDVELNHKAKFSSNSTVRCMLRVLTEPSIVNGCYNSCLDPCESYGVDSTITSIPWPGTNQRAFFTDKICSDMGGQINKQNLNCNSIAEMDNIIKRNFVKIHAEIPELVIKFQKEVPRITPPCLLSQIGGAMNLYAGISLVVVFEIFELVYWLFSSCSCSKYSESGDVKEEKGAASTTV